jgi:hypothetical protein
VVDIPYTTASARDDDQLTCQLSFRSCHHGRLLASREEVLGMMICLRRLSDMHALMTFSFSLSAHASSPTAISMTPWGLLRSSDSAKMFAVTTSADTFVFES